MRLIYINKEIYCQICDILDHKYVTLFDYEENLLDIIRREINSKKFTVLDGNIILDDNNNKYKLILI